MCYSCREAIEAAIATIRRGDFATGDCMCGSPMEGHGPFDGHTPTDSGNYYAETAIEKLQAALGELDDD